jgi:hypothetical protein
MHWSVVTERWDTIRAQLGQRFPDLAPDALHMPPPSREALERILAASHDLTLFEAREELEDLLQLESMALSVQLH